MPASTYDAFLSYSHAADGRLASFLQGALQSFAKPWYRRRALRVFRDTMGLEVTPDLWGAIRRALLASDYFVLLASEGAARSKWVDLELDTWLDASAADRVLIVWTDGHLIWDAVAGDFDWQRSTCLPPRLRGVFSAEPLHLDMRWARRSEDLSLRRPEVVEAVARLSSALRRVPLDDLIGEDVRQHRRTRRLATAAVATLSTLLVAAVAAATFAVQQRNAAQRGLLNLLLTNGTREIDGQDFSAAALWFAEAAPLSTSSAGRTLQRLRLDAAISQHPALEHVWFTESRFGYRSAGFSRDGDYVVAYPLRGELRSIADQAEVVPFTRHGPRFWNARTGEAAALDAALASTRRVLAHESEGSARRVLVTDEAGTVHLFDGGAERHRFDHPATVTAATFGPGHDLILTEAADDVARIWSARDGQLVGALPHRSPLLMAALGRDGLAITAAADGIARLWRVGARGTTALATLDHRGGIEMFDATSDGGHVVTVGGREARLWRTAAGEPELVRTFVGVNDAEFNEAGSVLLLADDFGEASLFNLDPLEPVLVVRHDGIVMDAAFNSDGQWFATAGTDRVARVWHAESGRPMSPRLHHEDTVSSVAFDGNRSRLVTTTIEGVVRVWNLDVRPPALRHESVRLAEWHPTGRLLTANDGDAKLWTPGRPAASAPLSIAPGAQLYHAAFNAAGTHIVTASEDGVARVWDAATGALVQSMRHDRRVQHSSFHPDGRRLVTAGAAGASDAEVGIWDWMTGRKLFTLPDERKRPVRAQFSADGSLLLTSGIGGATVWHLSTRQPLEGLRFDADVDSMTFSRDGRRLAGVFGPAVRLFDATRGTAIGWPIQHENFRVDDLAFGADSNIILVAAGGYARAWDVERNVPLTPLLTHGGGSGVDVVSASGDGRFIATASRREGTLRVWEAPTGLPVTPPLIHGAELHGVLFVDDSAALVSYGGNAIRLWPLEAAVDRRDDTRALEARLLAARHVDATGAIAPLTAAQYRRLWESRPRTQP